MGAPIMPNLKLMAVNLIVVCLLLVLAIDSSSPLRLPDDKRNDMLDQRLRATRRISPMLARFKALMLKRSTMKASNDLNDWRSGAFFGRKPSADEDVSRKLRTLRRYFGARSWADQSPRRYRREEDETKSMEILRREEYERRLFESLKIIGHIQATRLYVREDKVLVPIGTVVGKVRKLHPYGKVLIVWPYEGFRNFSLDADTGEVKTTALMDFELIRIYNMTIRDFQYNFTNPKPHEEPPMPDPTGSEYVDHYLIVEVVDINDVVPSFTRDIGGPGQFFGRVNQNARAGTVILQLYPSDYDSGPRGRIRYKIVTKGKETPFTIDPKTHMLKTNGKPLKTIRYKVDIEALDYGMPPLSSGIQDVIVEVEKAPPEFVNTPYNLNFSEASVRGSNVANVTALSRSGMPMTYAIIEPEARKTFAINHLGQITLLRELDYDTANDTDKIFRFTVRAKEDADQGQPSTVAVNLHLVNADDHLGTFKTPATKIRVKEGGDLKGGDVFTVEVDDCDCKKNCRCGSNEMIFTLGNTSGFFDITANGQIQNVKELDYETKNYFFFLVNVTDPGKNGRTRTSYIEVYVEDTDDTPPRFTPNEYNFFIFEDAPKDQVVGVAQAVDPDPSTKPDDVQYSVHSADPLESKQYFAVGNQGVITVNSNTDQFQFADKYELVIMATDSLGKVSDPRATVIIRILDVNDHQPEFTKCVKQKIKENQKIGTVLTTLTATDGDRGLNKLIEYSIQNVKDYNYFTINNDTGVVTTTHVLDREKYESIFVVAKATDGGSARSDALRQIGYCQFIVEVEDVNDHHPQFTVAKFDLSIMRSLAKNKQVLLVEAVDPDLGNNAVIKYRIKSQKLKNRNVDYFKINDGTGSLEVKNLLSSLSLNDKISVVIQAYNTVPVVLLNPDPNADAQSFTTVTVSLTTKEPPKFTLVKYVGNVNEDIGVGKDVLTVHAGGLQLYALQTEIRDRENLPFTIGSTTGNIRTATTLDFEKKKSYTFAVTATHPGSDLRSSAIVQINIKDIDDVVPIFGNDRYDATLSEAAKGGANVFRVKATDPDPIGGGEINYKIQKQFDFQIFTIEKKTNYAQIKTRADIAAGFFDREKKEVYTIIVEAYRGTLTSTASVIIKVRDENDSPPVFTQKFYNASIPEGRPVNPEYIVPGIKVMAVDKDILENANVSYFITSGNDGRFEMKTTYDKDQKNYGLLYVVRTLDVEKSPEFQKNPVYTLTVTATDRKHTDTAVITIRVLDRPETRPEFVEDYYEKYLPENVGAEVNVVQVQVKKPQNVEFTLDDIAKPYFTINKFNGLIKTGGDLLDWEKTPVITFPVYAYDKANPTDKGQTFVRVKLNDVNDAHPYFPDQPYIGYVRENQSPNAPVRYINGKDLDNPDVNFGNNVKLRYELLTNTGQDPWDKDGRLFKFNSQGLLVTRVTFNVEEYRRNLTIRVRAWDNGNPKLHGETDVTIVIRDVNEFPALFRKPRYMATVVETQPPGFVVMQLTVKDRDFAPLDNYAFAMLEGNEPYAFDIQQETGEIVVAGVLDYEDDGKKQYTLTVGLAERSDEFLVPGDGVNITVPFQDFAKVIIDITPGNDHRPTFNNKIFRAVVSEDVAVGTALNISIEATDGDNGFSNDFRFLITKGNMGDWFGVKKNPQDSNKAIVFVQYPLDREYQTVYKMELIVKDNGDVFDTANLLVTLTDVNDNAPVFQSSFYRATIEEPRCTGQLIATLTVADPDKPNQGPFSFTFAPGGNPGNRFGLREITGTTNSTELYCNAGLINREATPNFVVTVRATDNPLPRRTSTATVFINVKDVDDSPARSATMTILVNAIDGKFGGGPVGKTYFQDNDADGDSSMVYKLTSGSDEFTVKSDTGWINAKSTVKVGKYQLKIQGSKGGERPSCAVDINVRDVPAEAIEDSAAIQLNNLWDKNTFLNPIKIQNSNNFNELTYYDRFVNTLSIMFNVPEERVFVFSIQMSALVLPGKPMPSVDVRFAIQMESSVKSKFLPRTILINVLEKNNKTLKELLGFELGVIGIDYCANETLRVGMCKNDVVSKETYSVVSSDYGLMPAPNYALAVVSIDTIVDGTYSRYKEDPDPEYETCKDDHCLNGGTCHEVKPHGFVCECPMEYSGPRCQMTTRTFLGSSYIWLRPKTPYNYGSISFEFATKEPNGLLLYQGPAMKDGNNGRGDFLAVSLVQGRIKLSLSFGGKPLMFRMKKRLNDKKWHHVEVSHERKDVTLTIDHCKHADIVEDDERIVEKRENCETISRTILDFEYLNGLGPIQVGGIENMPLKYPSPDYVEYTYFKGCIRKIRDNLEMYDLGYPIKVENSPVGCTLMAECPKCLNGGYCEPGFSRSVCTCAMGFIGDDCSGNAPRFYYMANSYTEYKLPGEERRRKRSAANEPKDLLDRYGSYIAMQIRVDPSVLKAYFIYVKSETNMEYSILGYEEQKLYFEFKLLDAWTRLEMPGEVEIADGNWHNVIVTREGNVAVLQVDYKGRVSRNTGGAKRLIRMSSALLYVGGEPKLAANATVLNKTVEAKITDIRGRRRRSAGTIIGVTTDGREVEAVVGDMTGCTGSSTYNGKNLDTDPNVKATRFHVEAGCPCIKVINCFNGGVCVSAAVPYCLCTRGWSGPSCEEIVYVPVVLGNVVDGRARWKDGGVLIVILCVVLCVLILATALLFVKKRREAPYSLPVGDEGQDSIMPYHDEGAGEEDTFNYDIHHLMKYSYRDGHGTVTKPMNGKEVEHVELLTRESTRGLQSETFADGVDLWPFIQERVQKADEDTSWWPGEEMRHWDDEGDDEKAGDLSEIEESDDEGGADAEQDWDFLKDWGKKFENLNKIFNPDDDDEEEA